VKDKLDVSEFRKLQAETQKARERPKDDPAWWSVNVGAFLEYERDWLVANAEALIRAAEERDALLRCVEAADSMRTNWSAANLTRHPLPAQYDKARAALEALRSGKPREEAAQGCTRFEHEVTGLPFADTTKPEGT
jgi:hypothetical protein